MSNCVPAQPGDPTPGAHTARAETSLSVSSPNRAALRRQASIVSLLLLAAAGASSAQTARPDTLVLGYGTVSGAWSATNGSATYTGTWTAVPDTVRGNVIGTWTLVDARGAAVAFGGWSAGKAAARWGGAWRANVTGRPGEFSGTWTSSVALAANARFVELFEAAAKNMVSGAWASGGRSGGWSIRASK